MMALLTANSCGAFADACEDDGGTGDGFGWFVLIGSLRWQARWSVPR